MLVVSEKLKDGYARKQQKASNATAAMPMTYPYFP
jgi:hypothetical protein